jgi:uncharacterized protein YjbJ (UPF0337 family)
MAEIHDNKISAQSGATVPDPSVSSYPPGSYPETTAGGAMSESDTGQSSKTDQAKERASAAAGQLSSEAAGVTEHARGAASGIKQQAGSEISSVAEDAKHEVRSLASEARDRLGGRVDETTRSLAATLTDAGQELRAMAERSERQGGLTDLVRDLGDRTEQFGHRLESEGYQSFTNDVTRFARNRPGVFLLAAGTAGFIVGRMLRNTDTQSITQAVKGDQSISGTGETQMTYGQTAHGTEPAPDASAYAASMASSGAVEDIETGYRTQEPGRGI